MRVNLVDCGNCGKMFPARVFSELVTCPHCKKEQEYSFCPDSICAWKDRTVSEAATLAIAEYELEVWEATQVVPQISREQIAKDWVEIFNPSEVREGDLNTGCDSIVRFK